MTPPERLDGATLVAHGRAIAVTPHVLASRAAITIMEKGGNAADAAIAANATLGVVAPETCGIGGDLFALVHTPGDPTPATLNSSGRAGRGARAAAVRAQGHTQIPIDSPFAVTVPGCVDGWLAIATRFGSMPLGDVLAPAIEYARDGFTATPELAGSLDRFHSQLGRQPAATGLYPGGIAPQVGDRVTRPALAETLEAIGHSGRDAFYAGPVGEAIVTATAGILADEDLERDQARWIDPISLDVMGWTGWTIPPNSQGYLTLAAAWIFEQLDPPRDPDDPLFTHAAIEAFRAVAWERDQYVADPRFAPLPPERLLSTSRLEERLSRISLSGRTDWPSPQPAPGGTAYLCVRDTAGMGISLIQSNYHGIGSRIGAGDAGFFLHDRGSGFNLDPDHPNELAPGKQPLHTLSPSLWTRDGELAMLLGTRGGDFQPQTLLQMLTYMRWAGLDVAAAQQRPRWTTEEWRRPDPAVVLEPHHTAETVRALSAHGHATRLADGLMSGWGPVSVIAQIDHGGIGAADPRVASTAALAS